MGKLTERRIQMRVGREYRFFQNDGRESWEGIAFDAYYDTLGRLHRETILPPGMKYRSRPVRRREALA